MFVIAATMEKSACFVKVMIKYSKIVKNTELNYTKNC